MRPVHNNQLEKVLETEDPSIFTDSEQYSFDNSIKEKVRGLLQVPDDDNDASHHFYKMTKTLPSQADNPMLSNKFDDDVRQKQTSDGNGTVSSAGKNPIATLNKDLENKNKEYENFTKAHSLRMKGYSLQVPGNHTKTFSLGDTPMNGPPKMHLKETLQYNAAILAPTIKIFEEVSPNVSLKQPTDNDQGNNNIND